MAPSLLPPSLLPAHSSLPCSTSLASISAAVTKQEEEVACWRERGAEESSEEEEEDSEDCEEDEEEESDEEDKGWGCPNCGRVAHPQCRMPPSQVWRCSNYSLSSLTFDRASTSQNSPNEELPSKLTAEEEVSCQDEVGTCCHMHRHCQCCHRQLLHRQAHGTRRCLESGRELQNKECCSLMME